MRLVERLRALASHPFYYFEHVDEARQKMKEAADRIEQDRERIVLLEAALKEARPDVELSVMSRDPQVSAAAKARLARIDALLPKE